MNHAKVDDARGFFNSLLDAIEQSTILVFEQLSLYEAYLDVTENLKGMEIEVARELWTGG